MISSLLHLVGLRPRVYYTLTDFRGGGKAPLAPPLNTPMQTVFIPGHMFIWGSIGTLDPPPPLNVNVTFCV